MDSIDSSDSCSSTEAQLIIMTSNKKKYQDQGTWRTNQILCLGNSATCSFFQPVKGHRILTFSHINSYVSVRNWKNYANIKNRYHAEIVAYNSWESYKASL